MTSKRNIIDFAPSRRPQSPNQVIALPQLVVSAQRTAKHHLRQLLPNFFARIDDSLFDLADKAENNQQQTLYFDAMREIRLQNDIMQKTYFESLAQGFENSLNQNGNPQRNSISLDQIGLVEDEQLEESLAISNMVNNAEIRAKEALSGITTRLDFLIEDIEITKDNNPLRPEVLFNAFVPSVKKMDADIKIRLVIYKLFDKFVAQKIGPIYDTINADLIAAGVLPRIKSTIRKSEDTAVGYGTSTTEDEAPSVTAPAENASPHNESYNAELLNAVQPENMFNALQQLLSLTRATPGVLTGSPTGTGANIATPGEHTNGNAPQPGGIPMGTIPGNHTAINTNTTGEGSANSSATISYAPQQVLMALTQLQSNGTELMQQSLQAEQPSANVIKATLLQTMGDNTEGSTGHQSMESDGKKIGQADTDAIDIVSMLFDFILDDPSLPNNLKAQIARLQIPFLKVAILDKEFFTKKTHPARQLLNELAYAGSGLEEMDPEEDAVYQMVSYVVDSILAEFEENTEIFSTLHEEFVDFIDKERESNKLAEDMLENAKDMVATEIQRRVTDNRVPPLVSIILIEAWKDVLIHLYLRDGDESTAWNTALQVADDLIWSVQPKLVVSERQRLIKVIPRVLNGLRDGLTLIQFDPKATEQLFSGLEALHLSSLRGQLPGEETPKTRTNTATNSTSPIDDDFGVDMSMMPEATETKSSDNDDFMEEIILASTQSLPWENEALNASQFAEEIRDMALGTWVEFIDLETQQPSRGKLAWKCDFTGEYTFVDRTYQVVADLSNRKLIEKFELRQARFVDDVPLFDRALDSVIGGIKRALDNKAEAPATH